MRITFDNMSQVNTESAKVERNNRLDRAAKASASYTVAFDGKDRVGFGVDTPNVDKMKNVSQLTTQGADVDVQNMRNQLTVMSHTMSDEDFAKMQEEGYDPSEMDPQEAVTILDKIKAELVKAGVHVEGYTDRMDMDTLAAALGSEMVARTMVDAFVAQDIPLEQQNVDKVARALDMASHIGIPSESTYFYMAANKMSAVLKDFYLASASGSQVELEQSSQYFGEEVKGYITKNVSSMNEPEQNTGLNMENEIEKLLGRLGIEAGVEEKMAATWLIDKDLPVDGDAVGRMKDILAVQFPLAQEHVIATAAAAIADGVPVEEKNLVNPLSNIQKAVLTYEMYHGEEGLSLVQDRLKLEEVRLHMTVETNLKLLQSGFAIDTAPIEETIEALKNAEQQLAKQYFPQEQDAVGKYQLLNETREVLQDLPKLPIATIGAWTDRVTEGTLEQFHAEGKSLEAAYQKAGERYETLWTAPRADMGDNIHKAFANVDDILNDYAYELSEENRKAVRVLGYNRMEVTPENIERVKAATETVEQVIRQMTPAATLKMIRDGVNPLEMTMPELNKYFEELPQEYAETAEKYSKFLYRLDHAGELTAQEREAFIGCYRLLRQVEKSDGAAIGTLVNVGAELNFSNLLSAIRSGKFKGMDAKVDDMLGALSEETFMKLSISQQIQAGYEVKETTADFGQSDAEGGESRAQAAEEQRRNLQEASKAPTEVFDMLERGQVEPTAQNILAARELERNITEVLIKQAKRNAEKEQKRDLWQKLEDKEAFESEYGELLQEAAGKIEEATIAEADNVVDVRQMQLFHKQLHIMQKLAPAQEYYFPMEIGGEVTGIHLQIAESQEEKGVVRITMESAGMGKISGALQVVDSSVTGYFVGNQEETVMNLRRSSDIINKSLGEEWKFCEVEFLHSESNHIPMDWTRTSTETQVSTDSLYRLSKSFLQAVKAVGDNA